MPWACKVCKKHFVTSLHYADAETCRWCAAAGQHTPEASRTTIAQHVPPRLFAFGGWGGERLNPASATLMSLSLVLFLIGAVWATLTFFGAVGALFMDANPAFVIALLGAIVTMLVWAGMAAVVAGLAIAIEVGVQNRRRLEELDAKWT